MTVPDVASTVCCPHESIALFLASRNQFCFHIDTFLWVLLLKMVTLSLATSQEGETWILIGLWWSHSLSYHWFKKGHETSSWSMIHKRNDGWFLQKRFPIDRKKLRGGNGSFSSVGLVSCPHGTPRTVAATLWPGEITPTGWSWRWTMMVFLMRWLDRH